ncbi:MAG: hypothetical protein QM664_00140 [Flavihumibacter sp.]
MLGGYRFHYNSSSDIYSFDSVGTKGIVRKIVKFDRLQDDLFNVCLADLDPQTGCISDSVTTNNGDADLVLLTVASIGLHFMEKHAGSALFIQGSDAKRTRWYQMGLARNWRFIEPKFKLLGYKDENWEPFRKGTNYIAFYLEKRLNWQYGTKRSKKTR